VHRASTTSRVEEVMVSYKGMYIFLVCTNNIIICQMELCYSIIIMMNESIVFNLIALFPTI
jgi:hypothetical protein